jgi:hypothetical protein
MHRKSTAAILIMAAISLPGVAIAQEYGIPQFLLGEGIGERGSESQIVIRVRDGRDRSNLCGNGTNLSRLGIGEDFPRPGSSRNGYDFPRPGQSSGYDFPRPGGSSVNYFQLPIGARNPDLIGCIDTQRNIVFINIFKTQIKEQSPTPSQPQPSPTPTPEPTRPPQSQTLPNSYPTWSSVEWQKQNR